NSVVDYALNVPPGDYRLVLDTDEPRFGGQGRIAPGQRYFTEPTASADTHSLKFYLPCRTAIVIEKL
ncbi:MAG: hypothetical protein GY794_13290, partial [bacterium]|nr:hypothetical protein [bacterium]